MAFNFDKLTPDAKRAAFAHMDSNRKGTRRLGSGARQRAMAARHPKAEKPAQEPVYTGQPHPSGELSQAYLRGGKPTAEDHGVLARRYLLMHGSAGVHKRIAQLQARKRLSAKEQASLAALRALS